MNRKFVFAFFLAIIAFFYLWPKTGRATLLAQDLECPYLNSCDACGSCGRCLNYKCITDDTCGGCQPGHCGFWCALGSPAGTCYSRGIGGSCSGDEGTCICRWGSCEPFEAHCTAHCPSGWSESCPTGNCDSCTVQCGGSWCTNNATCYKAVATLTPTPTPTGIITPIPTPTDIPIGADTYEWFNAFIYEDTNGDGVWSGFPTDDWIDPNQIPGLSFTFEYCPAGTCPPRSRQSITIPYDNSNQHYSGDLRYEDLNDKCVRSQSINGKYHNGSDDYCTVSVGNNVNFRWSGPTFQPAGFRVGPSRFSWTTNITINLPDGWTSTKAEYWKRTDREESGQYEWVESSQPYTIFDAFFKQPDGDIWYNHPLIRFRLIRTPKTCSVSIPRNSITAGEQLTISYNGVAVPGQKVRLWFESRTANTQIIGLPGLYIGGGIYYYQVSNCIAGSNWSCLGSYTLPANLPVGEYYIHCDVLDDPGKCSGNPVCSFESGFCLTCPGNICNSVSCTGWTSCSNADNACFTVLAPTPTCTATLSPPSITLNQGETSPLVASVNVQNGTVDRVIFLSSNTSVSTVNPSSDSSFPYSTTVTAQGVGNVILTGNVYLNPGNILGCSANSPITVNPVAAWFQTKGGDVHADGQTTGTSGNIRSSIPSTCVLPLCSPYFSLKTNEGQPSVVSYTGTVNFGDGRVSEDYKWLAKSAYKGKKYGYDYFYKLVDSPTFTSHSGAINQKKIHQDLDSNNNIVAYDGDVATDAEWNLDSRKAVILINGRFLLKNRIRSDSGGSIVIVAKKGIGVSKNVVSDEGGNIIRAAFITDKIFYASVDPSFPAGDTFSTTTSDKKLVISGAVIAWENFNLTGRSSDNNAFESVELYRYDPAILLDSNKKLWQSKFVWEEIAP